MSKNIKILYVDDEIQTQLSHYLYNLQNFEYDELLFEQSYTYTDLLENTKIKDANIIIMDSKLFTNDNVNNQLITGEEFRIILQRYYPYKEYIIISSMNEDQNLGIIAKFNSQHDDFYEYYKKLILPLIEQFSKNIIMIQNILDKLKEKNIDKVEVEKIENCINGDLIYSALNTNDINELVDAIKGLENYIDE